MQDEIISLLSCRIQMVLRTTRFMLDETKIVFRTRHNLVSVKIVSFLHLFNLNVVTSPHDQMTCYAQHINQLTLDTLWHGVS
jgi:hypothetical protein